MTKKKTPTVVTSAELESKPPGTRPDVQLASERIHLFMATELTHGQAEREADEFADVVVMRLSEALELIQRGEIPDGKTALGLLYAAGFKTG